MPNITMQKAALVAAGAMALTACGGGGSDNAGPDGGGGAVNAFAYTQPIAASVQDAAEPVAVDQLVLSTSDTEEPDTRL